MSSRGKETLHVNTVGALVLIGTQSGTAANNQAALKTDTQSTANAAWRAREYLNFLWNSGFCMKVIFPSKLTDRCSSVLLTSRWDTVGFCHVINHLFPYLKSFKSICQNILCFTVSCILITAIFRALSFLDGTFCRFVFFYFFHWCPRENYSPQLARATPGSHNGRQVQTRM